MESYRFVSFNEAIKILQNLKKVSKNKRVIIFTINFDDNRNFKKMITTPDYGCTLVKKSKAIVINNDKYISHMQLFSIPQTDIKSLITCGIMFDIIF